MKKRIVKISLFMIFSLFIFTGGVVAAKLSAKDIEFTSTNEEWNVNNVEDAMNDLYEIGSQPRGLTLLNSFTANKNAQTIDCTSIPGWQDKTVENFVLVVTSASSSGMGTGGSLGSITTSMSLNLSYDNTTGILTIPATISENGKFNADYTHVTKTSVSLSGNIYYW